MKNILQVMPEFDLAGAETMCENLVYKLLDSGNYNVYVVSLYDKHTPITNRLESRGISVYYMHKKEGLDLTLTFRLSRLMRDLNIDLVHTHRYVMMYAIPASLIAGVHARVHTIHNVATKEVDSKRRSLAKMFYKYANVIPVSISPLVQESVMVEYNIGKQDTPVVFNGTDLSKCTIKTDYTQSQPFRFIHIGRFCEQKNHITIIEAARELRKNGYDFIIELIGDGEDIGKIRNLVEEYNLDQTVIFGGLKDNVYPSLCNSDCFILPSNYEGMPCSLVEAMGCGLPIIASAVGGVPDMIDDGIDGILISPNKYDLINSMIAVMKDGAKRAYLGQNALKKSKRFSSQFMAEGYINIYEAILSKTN